MGSIIGHADSKYVTGVRLASSSALDWSDILVERWRHAPGDLCDTKPAVTEVIVMLGGSIRVRRRGDGRLQHHDATPGTVWLCPAEIQEDLIRVQGGNFEAVHMFLPAAPLADSVLQEFGLDPDSAEIQYDGGFKDPLIEHIGRSIANELADPSPASSLIIDNLRTALSAYVIRHHSSVAPQRTMLPSCVGALEPRRLQRVLDYIDANLVQQIRLADLAAEACLSPFHFARAFKTATGTAPHAHLVSRRLERASTLVRSSDLALEVIAQRSGFSSQAQMTRVFSKVLGVTPGKLRRESGQASTRQVDSVAVLS